MKIFGFSDDGEFAPLPDDIEADSTITLSDGQCMTDAHGNTYTTTPADDDN
ncbi:hypothetical protein AB0F77_15255 [Streptomyces sp. NPDC026672]|uniref:hypothetical protein n=1 Tax=unclassified Streptomyces TaxID=2593676 RepID=UPI0033F082DF